MNDILNCPFCGGEADLWYKPIKSNNYRDKIAVVICGVCGASGKAHFCYNNDENSDDFFEQQSMKNAVYSWNRRVKD